ncbi:hypothetical protein CRUP_023880 [Coryphaenoides rupestris]|nr:hypothetical protein CRUP_023880 [Coryphaenoides rupestris]
MSPPRVSTQDSQSMKAFHSFRNDRIMVDGSDPKNKINVCATQQVMARRCEVGVVLVLWVVLLDPGSCRGGGGGGGRGEDRRTVILVLSTISAPIDTYLEGGSSRLYRSMDYGKSFRDVSHRIGNTFIRKEFGVTTGPGNSLNVILTADTPVVDNSGGIIFASTDAGVTFRSVRLPFHLAQPITFHFLNPNYLVVISIDGGLWLSLDFGASWRKVHDGAHSFMWGAGVTLFFSYSPEGTVEADRRGEFLLKRTEDLGMTFTTIAEEIFSFGYIGGFLITSVMEEPMSD